MQIDKTSATVDESATACAKEILQTLESFGHVLKHPKHGSAPVIEEFLLAAIISRHFAQPCSRQFVVAWDSKSKETYVSITECTRDGKMLVLKEGDGKDGLIKIELDDFAQPSAEVQRLRAALDQAIQDICRLREAPLSLEASISTAAIERIRTALNPTAIQSQQKDAT